MEKKKKKEKDLNMEGRPDHKLKPKYVKWEPTVRAWGTDQ